MRAQHLSGKSIPIKWTSYIRGMSAAMHLRYLKAVKFLALVPAQGLISLDTLLSNLQVADVATSSVVAESSGEEATADKSVQVSKCLSSFHITA